MISIKDLYNVLAAVVPLYAAMILAYGSVRWWKIFTPVQCSGINRFVATFAVPFLSFHFISRNNPYKMDGLFILADTISKVLMFSALLVWSRFSRSGSLDWLITLFSVATLPNTLVMGIPLLEAMYGSFYGGLMVQMVVLQCIIWYTLLLFLFEYRAARLLLMEQCPGIAASIISFKVDTDVLSLEGRDPLETHADVGDDGKIRVTIRKSTSSRSPTLNSFSSPRRSLGVASIPSSKTITPRNSNVTTAAELYKIYSCPNNASGEFGLNNDLDLHSWMSTRAGSPHQSNLTSADAFPIQSTRVPALQASNANGDNYNELQAAARALNSSRLPPPPLGNAGYPLHVRNRDHRSIQFHDNNGEMHSVPGLITVGLSCCVGTNAGKLSPKSPQATDKFRDPGASPRLEDENTGLRMLVWSSTASPASEGGLHVYGNDNLDTTDNSKNCKESKEVCMTVPSPGQTPNGDVNEIPLPLPSVPCVSQDFSFGYRSEKPGDAGSLMENIRHSISKPSRIGKPKELPPTTVMVKLIMQMVIRKLLHNPNTYSSLLGLAWSLVAFRWNVGIPKIIAGSIKIISDSGLGMAMFSLGLFMALQPRLIACGYSLAAFTMAIRFLTGPAVMAASSIAVGLRGANLHAAIVQAALPQGIVPFVFAREYDLHPDILSTAVIFGMLIALPITLFYYAFFGLCQAT